MEAGLVPWRTVMSRMTATPNSRINQPALRQIDTMCRTREIPVGICEKVRIRRRQRPQQLRNDGFQDSVAQRRRNLVRDRRLRL
jgi:hypothetical protein